MAWDQQSSTKRAFNAREYSRVSSIHSQLALNIFFSDWKELETRKLDKFVELTGQEVSHLNIIKELQIMHMLKQEAAPKGIIVNYWYIAGFFNIQVISF